ncbi:MAG: hypothetical protein ACI4Q3_06655, partial [Kiritimatiellia bacterium]
MKMRFCIVVVVAAGSALSDLLVPRMLAPVGWGNVRPFRNSEDMNPVAPGQARFSLMSGANTG